MKWRRLWPWSLALAIPFVIALGARLSGSGEVFEANQVHLIDADSHYHAWRMIQAREHFPAGPPRHDPLIAFPEGYLQVWPPGFDYLGGILGVLYGAPPHGEAMARLGTLLVVLLGAMTILLLVFTLRRFVTALWAGLGGVILALWPLHIEYSRIGRIDHHVLEPLMTLLLLVLYFAAAHAPDRRRQWGAMLGLGLALGACFWLWPTAFFSVAVVGFLMLGHQLWRCPRPIAAAAFGIALCLAAPLCLAEPYRQSWALHTPSLFHLTLLATLALISLWLAGTRRFFRHRHISHPVRLTAIFLGAAALATLPLWGLVSSGEIDVLLHFGGRQGLWSMVLEQRPLFSLPWPHQLLLVTYLFFALPLLWSLSMLAPLPSPRRDEIRLYCAAAVIFTAAGLVQLRFLPLSLPLNALLIATGLAELHRRLLRLLRGHVRPGLRRLLGPALAMSALVLVWPAADYIFELKQMPSPRNKGVEQAARWIRQHPLPPRSAVLAPLGAGHPLVHLGRQAVVGSTLIAPQTEQANRETISFFITSDPKLARQIIQRRSVGRVLQTRLKLKTFVRLNRYLGRPLVVGSELDHYRRSMASRLTLDSGSATRIGPTILPAVGWLQHQWEQGPPGARPLVQVFKVVRGALLEGQATPGQEVRVHLPLLTNQGRPFIFWAAQVAGARGEFSLRIPYWTATPEAAELTRASRGGLPRTIPAGLATLTTATGAIPVEISESAVESGLTIPIRRLHP